MPAGHVQLDGVGRRAVLSHRLRSFAVRLGSVRRMAGLGVNQRTLPPVLGVGAERVPAVPGGVSGDDYERAVEPRAILALPGAGWSVALQPRATQQLGRLSAIAPVRFGRSCPSHAPLRLTSTLRSFCNVTFHNHNVFLFINSYIPVAYNIINLRA